MRRLRHIRRYRTRPERRFLLWFKLGELIDVRFRDDRPAPPHLLNLYVVSRPIGRYWLTWSLNLARFIEERSLWRLRRRYPTLEAELAAAIAQHLEALDAAG